MSWVRSRGPFVAGVLAERLVLLFVERAHLDHRADRFLRNHARGDPAASLLIPCSSTSAPRIREESRSSSSSEPRAPTSTSPASSSTQLAATTASPPLEGQVEPSVAFPRQREERDTQLLDGESQVRNLVHVEVRQSRDAGDLQTCEDQGLWVRRHEDVDAPLIDRAHCPSVASGAVALPALLIPHECGTET